MQEGKLYICFAAGVFEIWQTFGPVVETQAENASLPINILPLTLL
jgi:hypothetical protein